MRKAIPNGITHEGATRLTGLLHKHRDIFRTRLGPDPPAQVEPMQVVVKPHTNPLMENTRRPTPEQCGFFGQERLKATSLWIH